MALTVNWGVYAKVRNMRIVNFNFDILHFMFNEINAFYIVTKRLIIKWNDRIT